MEFNKLINMLLCVILYISQQLGSVSSIYLVSGPDDARVALGKEVIFTCDVADKYPYSIRWWYVGSAQQLYISTDDQILDQWPVNSESIYTIVPGSNNLNISNVQLTDAGKYECIFGDGVYHYYFHPTRAEATLTVLQPPSVNSPLCSLYRLEAIEVPSNTQFYVGESVRFQCSSEGHGNTIPILNITKSNVDVIEYVFVDGSGQKKVNTDEFVIESIDTEFKCYLQSEALTQPKVCEIKLNVLLPLVEIEPRSASVLESSNVSFQCSGSRFKTDRLQYSWKISPDAPGKVVNFTSSVLEITNIGENMTFFDIVFIVTCFVRDNQMVLNSSNSFSISPKKRMFTNNINNNKNESGTSLIGLVVAIALITVVVAIILAGVFRMRHRKLSEKKPYGRHLNTGALNNEQLYSVVQNKNINAHGRVENIGQNRPTSGCRTEIKVIHSLNITVGHNESAVYYSTVPAENNQESDNNYDNIGHSKESFKNEPLYENKGFTPDITELNAEGLNYADLDLEMVSSHDIIDTGPRTTYSTVTIDAN
ncbi:uncharacterized protein LOC117110815 [Anneissia japonica]|uniref:uncharacterized protein LOC117110815 n=1 Tax=Anneissia japonica TaxID=1529436 RepID=UPI0014255A0F|nr:uncharacterized protein LOC117110815 [Anneissia japonica]